MAETKKVYNYTLKPSVVNDARKKMEREKKKIKDLSLSQVVEELLVNYVKK